MFGYVTARKPELRIYEFEIYKAYYCGVCKSCGKRAGQLPRLALSYDFAFLALLLSALTEREEAFQPGHCVRHPLKKMCAAEQDPFIDYAADMMVLLTYYKCLDDKADEHRLRGSAGAALLMRRAEQLGARYPRIAETIDCQMEVLSRLEAQRCSDPDRVSDTFAGIMEEIFAGGPQEAAAGGSDPDRRTLRHLGRNLGRWIYLIDALDDLAEDAESGAYNVLLLRYERGKEEPIASFRQRICDNSEFFLMNCLSEAGKAVELLDIRKNHGIINNIIYRGLLCKTEEILQKADRKTRQNSAAMTERIRENNEQRSI